MLNIPPVSGLLVSQIGYDLRAPMRAIYRGATAENDGPWRYSDEDWLPHAGGWVSSLTYLRQVMAWAIEEA